MNPALLRRRRRRGGAAAFSPLSLSPLVWLDAGALVLADGASVNAWTDSSGHGNTAFDAGATTSPAYILSGINGLPSVRFVASSAQYFDLAGLAGLTAAEVFVVMKRNADPPANATASGLWLLGTSGSASHVPYISGTIFDDAFATTRQTVGDPAAPFNSAVLYNVSSGGGVWTSRANGTVLYTDSHTFGVNAGPLLGASYGGSYYMDGLIAQFLVFSSVLTAPNRTLLQNWAFTKYGISP